MGKFMHKEASTFVGSWIEAAMSEHDIATNGVRVGTKLSG
jgi:hypothetical protein